jgi:hypothetical protein
MNKDKTKVEHPEKNSKVLSLTYKRPELKKHGKLKNTASQSISTYTYHTVL